jgi:hypothetical protein
MPRSRSDTPCESATAEEKLRPAGETANHRALQEITAGLRVVVPGHLPTDDEMFQPVKIVLTADSFIS